MLLATAILTCLTVTTPFQEPIPEDPSAPLRRFPVSFLVHRQGVPVQEVSLLRLSALRPKDEIQVKVGDRLTDDWTLGVAYLSAAQKPRVTCWNLWDKQWKTQSIKAGVVPDGNVVPLFFLVLNRKRDGRVASGLQHALETSTEQVVNATAAFDTTYQAQDRLYNFMVAYSALGSKAEVDSCLYKNTVDRLGLDLGIPIDPYASNSSPNDIRKGLNVGVGALTALRKAPDDPQTTARIVQNELPNPVADWLGLASDLVRIFVKPRRDLKLTMVPASASEPTTVPNRDDNWLELVTERVLDMNSDAIPAIVYRPRFDSNAQASPLPLQFDRMSVVAPGSEVAIPLGAKSRDLFVNPWAWDWQMSTDGQTFSDIDGARLVPGRGLVFPVDDKWWGPNNERQIWVRANVGFQAQTSDPVKITRAFAQEWSPDETDIAVSDGNAQVSMTRKGGVVQPYYNYAAGTLTDSSGKVFPATSVQLRDRLYATFNLAQAAPGMATVRLQQEGSPTPDTPVNVFIAPKRPTVSFSIANGDNVLSANGPDAPMVKSIDLPVPNIIRMDQPASDEKNFILSGPLPQTVTSLSVTYYDPSRPNLEWKRIEAVRFGSPRPKFAASLVGALPGDVAIGAGADPNSAIATMPAGWFRSRQPIRLKFGAISPFSWSHDLALAIGFGSANDVQSVIPVSEGPSFTIDTTMQSAGMTLSVDDVLPKNATRTSGLVWVRVNRGDRSSPWTLAMVGEGDKASPLRAVRLPNVISVDRSDATRTRITLGASDDVIGVRFGGADAQSILPTLVSSVNGSLTAYVDGPAGATEFDLQMRDAPEAMIHVKVAPPSGK